MRAGTRVHVYVHTHTHIHNHVHIEITLKSIACLPNKDPTWITAIRFLLQCFFSVTVTNHGIRQLS